MTSRQALALIEKHGIVLEAAHGPVPSLAELIAGSPIRGSWWSHPKGREIFTVTRAVRDSDDVLVSLGTGQGHLCSSACVAGSRPSGEPVSRKSACADARGALAFGTSRNQRGALSRLGSVECQPSCPKPVGGGGRCKCGCLERIATTIDPTERWSRRTERSHVCLSAARGSALVVTSRGRLVTSVRFRLLLADYSGAIGRASSGDL